MSSGSTHVILLPGDLVSRGAAINVIDTVRYHPYRILVGLEFIRVNAREVSRESLCRVSASSSMP